MRVALAFIVLGSISCSTRPALQGGAVISTNPADSVAWAAGTSLPSGRDHHGTFVTTGGGQAWLWVAGGNDYKAMMSDTWRAPIAADGSLGAWIAGPSLPAKNAGMGVSVSDLAPRHDRQRSLDRQVGFAPGPATATVASVGVCA